MLNPMPKRFWKGKKRLAKKYLGNRVFNMLFDNGVPKVGDLTHDCDGFNHVITRVSIEYDQFKGVKIPYIQTYYSSKYIADGLTKEYEHPVCGCQGIGWQLPLSREEIESWALSWAKMKEQQIAGGWGWDPVCDTWAEIILSGGHIVCEKGLRL